MRDEKRAHLQTWIQRINRSPNLFFYFAMALYMFVNNTINASSDWMETTRDENPQFSMWEPFVWEYTSMLAVAAVLPFLMRIWKRYPLRFSQIKRQIVLHFMLSILFAITHVGLMVLMREGIYLLLSQNYDFGPLLREFIYEYRKDVWGYLTTLLSFTLFHILYSRLKGEASFLNQNSETDKQIDNEEEAPVHLLVKKLDREFLIKVADIDWMESSGNYVNLHCEGRIYPLRGTLTELTSKLDKQFSRVHRSHSVNHNAVESIQYQASGDGEIALKNGARLSISRRYKDALKQKLTA